MKRKWWHDKVAYQIYPKSFLDTNGDGIGDLKGIISKLDYLKELGIDIIWLSPVYESPFVDQGYDISDYYKIAEQFGTMDDFDTLVAEMKKRGMHLIMDLVVNHCSDKHEWFQKAVQDPEGKYGNFFYIEDKKDDRTPCNWRSYFGGSVWEELPGHSDKQYLHLFHKKQPDLNWENPEVREEVFKNIRWWMEKGLGGFRIDAIINIKKKLPFQDYPADRSDGMCSVERMLEDADGIGKFLGEMAEKCFHPYDAFTVGEVFNEKEDEICDFIGENGYFSSMFDFEETCYGKSEDGWYASKYVLTPEDYKKCIFHTQQKIGETGLISNIIENHDEPRGVCHYILPEDRCLDSKKLLAGVYFFLRGIPFIYQGQEIGMENMDFTSMEQIDDISTIDEYKVALNAGCTEKEALQAASAFSRDNARTPVQWNTEKNAGFTTGIPWLEVNPDYKEINVESQLTDSGSLLSFYKKMTALRKTQEYKDTFVYGSFKPYKEDQENLIAYTRIAEKNILVMGNLQSQSRNVELPGEVKNVLLNNQEEVQIQNETISLNPYQFVILEY